MISRPQLVELAECPYCGVFTDSQDLICQDCKPLMDIDLAVADITTAVMTMREQIVTHTDDPAVMKYVMRRLTALKNIQRALNEMIDEIETKVKEKEDERRSSGDVEEVSGARQTAASTAETKHEGEETHRKDAEEE